MMKLLFTLAAFLITSVVYGQGIYNKAATNIKQNRMMVDSVLGVPRDTTATNLATYLTSPVGDSARIAWHMGRFWGHTATGWRGFSYNDEVPIGGVSLAQMNDSLAKKANNYLTGLSTYPDSVLQPTDSVLRAFEKIQGQFNGIIGRYIENQDAAYQIARFTLAGASKIRSTTSRANLTLVKGPADTTYAIVAVEDNSGNRLGYFGAPSFTDPNSLTLLAQLSRMYYIARDTASHIFGSFHGSTSSFYTYARNGHWRFYREAVNPFDHDHTNYSTAYTLQVDGQLRFDTLRALNYTSATAGLTGTSGKYLGVDANGDVRQYDLRADQAWLNGRSMLYTISSDTLQNISQATNYHWAYVRRSTGAVNTNALFINGSTGKLGVNTASPSSMLTVKGSVSATHTVTAGNLTLSDVHNVVRISNASHVITLPTASGAYSGTEGRIYTVINYTASPATISSVQVYGVGTTAIPANTSWTIQSDGTNWILISRSN